MDLILRGGHVIDPGQGLDGVMDVGFAGGTVAAVAERLEAPEAKIQDVSGLIVTPGLIDLHTHVYWGGTSLGVDADALGARTAVTTMIDTGSAGPGNFAGFRTHVIERAETRILAYLHVSFAGIWGFGREVHVGESEDIRLMAPREAAEVAAANRDVIVGIKVRVGRHASGDQGLAPLGFALQVAEEVDMPLMAHIDEPPPSYAEVLETLRPGDVLTHAFRPFPNAPVIGGQIRPEVRAARERGVIFDIGHGMGSFSFAVARAMLAGGFAPDTISSDVHSLCIDGPAYDQLVTMSKFLCLGMSLSDVIAASTVAPARALGRPDLGTLRPGAAGDASVVTVDSGVFDYRDVLGAVLAGDLRIAPRGMVRKGVWHGIAL
ncbi:MAG: amidohydrolase/deacetylase family metallohydrolase [Pseudomonadota bacterium]